MAPLELLALAAALLLNVGGLAVALRESRRARAVGRMLFRAAAWERERQRLLATQAQLGGAQSIAEGTTALVQAVHQGIAAIPFTILEAIPGVREPTRVVRTVHDAIAGAVYGSIRGVNRLVGAATRAALDDGSPARPEPAATPAPQVVAARLEPAPAAKPLPPPAGADALPAPPSDPKP